MTANLFLLILGISTGALAFHLGGAVKGRRVNPCKSGHEPVPIDVISLSHEKLAFPQTILLLRCSRCGVHSISTFIGEWCIEDFLKIRSDAAGEMSELERMSQ